MVYNFSAHMRSLFQNKNWTLLLAVIALVALTVLAVGLRDVSFSEAQPLGWRDAEAGSLPPVDPARTFSDIPLQSQIILWVALLVMTVLVSLLLSPETRKYFLRLMLRIFVTYWLLYFVFKNYGDRLTGLMNLGLGGLNFGQLGDGNSDLPPPTFVPPQDTLWLSYITSILFVLFLLFAVWRVVVFMRRFSLPGSNEKPLDEIAKIARSSLRDLTQGGDTTDVIMNCYFRMSNVVSDKRRLKRKDSMTPAEFAIRLEQAGLPGDAVQRLTRLFEGVRYGGHRSGPKDVNEAVACLTSILNYCGEPV